MKILFEEPSHESCNMDMSPHRELAGEERVSPQRNETDRASLEKMHEDDMHNFSPLPNVLSPPRRQPTQSCVLKQILDAMGMLDKKVDALNKKVDVLDKKIDAIDKKVDALDNKVMKPRRNKVKRKHVVETTSLKDEDDGIDTMDHTIETVAIEDEDDGIRTIDDTLETAPNEDEDGGVPNEDGDGGVPNEDGDIKDDILCVPLEVEQLCGDIDTSDAKVKVHKEDCTRDDKSIEMSETDDQLLEENDAGLYALINHSLK